jgi:hypothetical protein
MRRFSCAIRAVLILLAVRPAMGAEPPPRDADPAVAVGNPRSSDRFRMADDGTDSSVQFPSLWAHSILSDDSTSGAVKALDSELERRRREIEALRNQRPAVSVPDPTDQFNKEVELQQKQIQSLEKMVRLLADQSRQAKADAATPPPRSPNWTSVAPVYLPESAATPLIFAGTQSPGLGRGSDFAAAGAETLFASQFDDKLTNSDGKVQTRVELDRKQIELLEKMVRLLKEQLDKQTPEIEQLRTLTAELDGRSKQAARRDVELANGLDDLVEHIDSEERFGPRLSAQLHELFLHSGNNETPLSIYGALAFGYSKIEGQPGGAYFGEFSPDFFLVLNDWIMLEAEIGVGAEGSVNPTFAQADFIVNDWLTIIAGRFVAPIGWFNERLNNPWINKLPGDAAGSAPLPWLQVLPPMSLIGVQARGAFYLGRSPLKLEYSAYISNGLNLTPATAGSPTIDELANLENMTDTFNVITSDPAVGGRLGLWWPEKGLELGVSGMHNGDYVQGFEDTINLFAVDLNYHQGNWDVRAEYGSTYQQAKSFIPNNIRREGGYAQVAFRPYDATNKHVQRTELVYRFSWADFHGIDAASLDFSTYATPIDVPIRRQQNEFGINYYPYQRMVLKCAVQINSEPAVHLHDNQIMTELAWGW